MFELGKWTIKNNLCLAPMAGVTDSVFRRLCVDFGAGYITSEMVSCDTTLHNSQKTLSRVQRAADHLPHTVQIVGSDPHSLAEAAQYNVRNGADIIDINMGCPAKKVCNKAAGSALLSDEKLVSTILQSVVGAVTVPVTLKIRTGPSRDQRNGVTIAKIAEAAGIQALAVHGRTREDRFKGQAEYDTIAAIKQAVTIPVIANGDITTPQQAAQVLDVTGADAIMVGRAAQGRPWLFREIRTWLDHGTVMPEPTDSEVHAAVVRHVHGIHALYGEYRGVRIARKHIAWYCKHKRNSAAFREQINYVESAAQQIDMIHRFYSGDTFATAA